MRPLSAVIPAAGPCDPAYMHELLARSASAFMYNPTVQVEEMEDLELRNSGQRIPGFINTY
jgi:hypothetical protein